MDICYGFLTIISANFTKQMDTYNKIIPVYEVQVYKGCGKKADFMHSVEKGRYLELKMLRFVLFL